MLTTHLASAALARLIATGGPLDPANTYLTTYTAITDRGPATAIGDLTEPTLADYPRQAVTTWGTPYVMPDGSAVVDSPVLIVVPPDNTHPTVVEGFALVDAATAGNLLEFVTVNPSVSLTTTLTPWSVVVRVVVDPSGNWDASISWGP